jgi:GMC oxidoreductase
MIYDLCKNTPNDMLNVDLCIVGAGVAGLFLANYFIDHDPEISIVILEQGGLDPLWPKLFKHGSKSAYRGLELGRKFGVGGTSSIWGGQMIEMGEHDFQERLGGIFPEWPIEYQELQFYYEKVRNNLGLLSSKYCDQKKEIQIDEFDLKFSEWLPFKDRNFKKKYLAKVVNSKRVDLWINSTLSNIEIQRDNGISVASKVEAQSKNGHTLSLKTKYLALCAGSIESTKIMLTLKSNNSDLMFDAGGAVGGYLSDHLSVQAAKVDVKDWWKFNSLFSPVFHDGILSSGRFEINPSIQKEMGIAAGFAHFSYITSGASLLDIAKKILLSVQGKDHHLENFSVKDFFKIFKDIVPTLYFRLFLKRLWFPKGTAIYFQVDVEQLPEKTNCILLEEHINAKDSKGLVINWSLNAGDLRAINIVIKKFIKNWNESALSRVAEIHTINDSEEVILSNLHDVYHPIGTLRMGANPKSSVVDSNLKVWGLRNIFVISTATFPSMGGANPGLTHLALALRFAEKVIREIKK